MSSSLAVGVDIGGTQVRAALVDTDGQVLARADRSTPGEASALLAAVAGTVDEVSSGRTIPIGVGIAGLVDADGVFHYGPNLAVRDLPIGPWLAQRTSAPVAVANDASVAALGEQRFGAGQGHRHVLLVTLGTGVGGGVVIDGQLLTGAHGFAAELGHVVVRDAGRRCPCGADGCVEAYASGTAIAAVAGDRLAATEQDSSLRGVPAVTGPVVTAAAADGDALAIDVLRDGGRALGVMIASVTNVLDPSVILLAGGVAAAAARWYLPAVDEVLATNLLGAAARRPIPPVRLADLGEHAGVVGAACLVRPETIDLEVP